MPNKLCLLLAFVVVATGGRLLAGDSPAQPAPCPSCAAEKSAPARDACCLPAPPADSVSTLTRQSLYQVDSPWTTDTDQSVTLTALRGRPVVLAMFFASCEYACPVIVDDLKRIGAALPEGVRAQTQFVLVSFDSARDTPAALHAYRERLHLDSSWTLLHGDAAGIQELAMLLGVKFKADARGQFSHSNVITVLNPAGEISFQRTGLMGDISETARAVAIAAQSPHLAAK